MGNRSEDRRRYIRVGTEAEVACQVQDPKAKDGSRKTEAAKAKNLGVEGICFVSAAALEPGSILDLEIKFYGEVRPLRLEGVVRWSRPLTQQDGKEQHEIGVRLFTLDKNDEGRFVRYVCDKMMKRFEDE